MGKISFFLVSVALLAAAPSPAPAGTWVTQTVDSAADVGQYSSIALDSSGNPHISYYDNTNGDLKYAYFDGSSWHISTVDSNGDVGEYCSMALDSLDRPHISYRYDSTYGDLMYAYHDGTQWQISDADSTSHNDYGKYTSIALDSADRPHISHYDDMNNNLRYTRHNGTGWQTEIVWGGWNDYGKYSSIALDSLERPHICYHFRLYASMDSDLKYTWYDGSEWQVKIITIDAAYYNSIAIDKSDYSHISWYNSDSQKLYYSFGDIINNTFWGDMVVDDAGNVGEYNSLGLDRDRNPRISYYDRDNGNLNYAACAEWNETRTQCTKFQIETVDSSGDVGRYTSIALDSSGNVHISYYDVTNGDLKYALLKTGEEFPWPLFYPAFVKQAPAPE